MSDAIEQLGGGGGEATAAAGAVGAAAMRLYALIEHQGSFSGGHYIAYVRLDKRWYQMNDSIVTEVAEEDVCGKQAFMLFYDNELA